MIINTFKTEKELFSIYPKTNYFKLKDIFNDYWDSFLGFTKSKNITIRPVVIRDVEMLDASDGFGVDTSVPPRFDCENCPGKMEPIYYIGVNDKIYEYKEQK